MPILIVVLCFVIIIVGALNPASENATRSAKQAFQDRVVFENRRFADASEAIFRIQKSNHVLGKNLLDSSGVPHPTGFQLVQERLFSMPGMADKFAAYTNEPISAAEMQPLLNQALGTIPNFLAQQRLVTSGEGSVQRWTIKIDGIQFQSWLLAEDAWLVARFGPTQAPKYSRWVALVNVMTTETYWHDPVGLDGKPFDCPPDAAPDARCTSSARPTRAVSLTAIRYKRVLEMSICFGKPGPAAAPVCDEFVVNGWNACTEPKCENFVVGSENGCPGGVQNQYSKELVRVSP
jgi:hypothetical protein